MRIVAYVFLIAACLLPLCAAPAAIGIVRSYGEFRLDGAPVRGNGTLMSGDVVESMNMNTTVSLGPTDVILMPESRATLYADHTTLLRGSTLQRGVSSRALEAGNLRIVPLSGPRWCRSDTTTANSSPSWRTPVPSRSSPLPANYSPPSTREGLCRLTPVPEERVPGEDLHPARVDPAPEAPVQGRVVLEVLPRRHSRASSF